MYEVRQLHLELSPWPKIYWSKTSMDAKRLECTDLMRW